MALSSSNATNHLSSLGIHGLLSRCFQSTPGAFIITTFTCISILLLLPLFVCVLYVGCQRRQQQQRSSATTSHSDLITYHTVIMELISIFGIALSCCGIHADSEELVMLGVFILPLNINGQMAFHILTCIERYLAIVHPVTYLSLKSAAGIRIRNIAIGCVWFMCIGSVGPIVIVDELSIIITSICTVGVSIFLVSFCSISVLCALVRPGPGEGGGNRQRINQSKLRAFYTIMVILGVLLLRVGGNMFTIVTVDSLHLDEDERCRVWMSVFWFCLPSSLVLPLLFLHRAGKLPFCKTSNSGQELG